MCFVRTSGPSMFKTRHFRTFLNFVGFTVSKNNGGKPAAELVPDKEALKVQRKRLNMPLIREILTLPKLDF